MHTKRLRLVTLSALLVVSLCSTVAQSITPPPVGTPAPVVKPGPKVPAGAARELDWDELLPRDARARFSGGPPPPTHDTLGEGGLAAQQMMDLSVNKALDGALIKIPGFIVPLDVGKDGLVTDFFLVPYFGACIHVPPPPPNQIVHVRISKGIALYSIYEAYWITGRMKVVNKSTRLGASAYQLAASNVEIYKY